jgi:hypothetical protein
MNVGRCSLSELSPLEDVMPIKYKIFQDRKLIYARGIGKIAYDDLLLHFEKLAADPKYISPMKKLVDYRTSTLSTLSTKESIKVTEKKAQLIETFKNEKCAFLTKSDLDFGMTRFHEAHIDDSSIMTYSFRNIEDALAWLEVDLEENEIYLG